jgi:hypothetical protein
MKRRYLTLALALFLSQSVGCSLQRPSPWKIHGGLKECLDLCRVWDLEFVAMVGVGDQGPSTEGASACVCQARKTAATAEVLGAAAAAASLAGPISAAQAAANQAEAGGP